MLLLFETPMDEPIGMYISMACCAWVRIGRTSRSPRQKSDRIDMVFSSRVVRGVPGKTASGPHFIHMTDIGSISIHKAAFRTGDDLLRLLCEPDATRWILHGFLCKCAGFLKIAHRIWMQAAAGKHHDGVVDIVD